MPGEACCARIAAFLIDAGISMTQRKHLRKRM